jgi:hypothetical protein
MPAVQAIIEHGTIPGEALEDETSLLVQSVTKTGSREAREYMNAEGAVQGIQERNPKLVLSFDTYITEYTGLAAQHPGTEVVSLANFQVATLGFTPGDGTLIFRDPVITESNSDAAKMTFTVTQFPFV